MLVEFGFRNIVIEWGINKEGHKVMKFQRVVKKISALIIHLASLNFTMMKALKL